MGVVPSTQASAPGKRLLVTFLGAAIFLFSGTGEAGPGEATLPKGERGGPFLVVLGIAQDGGAPQAGCTKSCCLAAREGKRERHRVSSLGIVDPGTGGRWIIDATPDFPEQLHSLNRMVPQSDPAGLDGILLTHGHVGHYAGLIHLGREAMGAREIPVYAMPRMAGFLKGNGPWDQLVRLKNVALRPLETGRAVTLNDRISVTPFRVPHRDEYTETVGFRIRGPERSAIYLPDIDRWEGLEPTIENMVREVDVAFLDGTFYFGEELPGRDLSEIPHPFIVDTMERLEGLPERDRSKVRFLHLNHTNPALAPGSEARREIERKGFRVAAEGERFPL